MRLLLVEDNTELAAWLTRALQQSGYAVDVVQDGATADRLLSHEVPFDAVILDRMLPGLDGLEVLRRLRGRKVAVPVLLLTAMATVEDRVAGFDRGADDYLIKPFALAELEARLRALIRRAHGHSEEQLQCGPLSFEPASRRFFLDGAELSLTPRERSVLESLILRAGRTVTKEALFETVFGFDQEAGPDAVEVYVHRLRKKLNHPGVRIATLRGLGYALEAVRAA